MIHLVVFRAKSNAHDQILIGFFNKQAKSIPKQVNNNHEWFEWGNAMWRNNDGLNGVFL
ncbi:hypothetical protein HMPREF1395_00686 [Helicobacter pylori GAM112Ai]|nr:hypothetical protein HMPREF1395_00686 [Helicobacter pylori GAM112Ai]EMH31944.1 hypothetical protein HMPREF1424_01459 [Helicobacter pylori GAM42Ai]